MSDPGFVDTLALVVFVVFIGMLLTATLSIAIRVGRWHVRGIAAPVLLIRDLLTIGGLAISFLMITAARAMELPPEYTRTVPWILLTSGPAIVGLGVFLYFEFFVIGHEVPIRKRIWTWFAGSYDGTDKTKD